LSTERRRSSRCAASALVVALLVAGLTAGSAAATSVDDFEPASCIRNDGIGAEPFVDVAGTAFYGPAVAWAYANGVVEGTAADRFSPNDTMTRGQFAAVLYRVACTPDPAGSASFDDLRIGAFYLDAVDWLVGENLTNGIAPKLFGPERTLTRGEFVTFLHRLAGLPAGSPAAGFIDVAGDAFYADAVDWALHRGLTTGTSATTFSPERALTRGEAVTFLYRLHTVGDIQAQFTTVVSGLDFPVAMAQNPATGTWFIAEKDGTLVRWTGGDATTTAFSQMVSGGGEEGLLGVTFTTDGSLIYLSYTLGGFSIIDEFEMAGDTVDAGTRREILRVAQPAGNHNGGDIHIGPDGYLYIGLGDGGGANDNFGNGQNLQTLLGAILRIDPANPSGGNAYGIPADNPFVGDAGARDEIWVYGVRNPWRFSFDQQTDDLWIADVGQDAREEITRLQGPAFGRGANLGWPLREGSIPTPASVGGPAPPGAVGPIHEYGLSGNQSITGGYVYRGSAIPALDGVYLFADFYLPTLMGWRDAFGTESAEIGPIGSPPTSFGQDATGEVYVLTADGRMRKLVPA
jgi:glucose/arabinose dehydrogenase